MTDRLLELFERSDREYISGEELSGKLNISRTAVWKQIERLKQQGFQFEAIPRKGYKLVAAPEKFDVPALLASLRTDRFGKQLKYHDEVDSTQSVAQQLTAAGAPEGTVVLAELQTAGRGRMGRHWHSPKGKGLWFSLILRPDWLPLSQTPQLTLLTAVALCRSVLHVTGLDAGIKWPNDLLIDGRKVAGILLEASVENGTLQHVIAGVGISVNLTVEDYPPDIRPIATSLAIAAGRRIDRSQLLGELLAEWERLYALYRSEGFAPIKLLWEALTVSLGKAIVCRMPQETVEGFAEEIDEHGALIVRLNDGTVRKMFSGDVEFK